MSQAAKILNKIWTEFNIILRGWERKYLQIMYLIRGQNPKYIRDTYDSMTKKKKKKIKRQKNWIEVFSQDDLQMANRYKKRFSSVTVVSDSLRKEHSTSIIIGGMIIKIRIYHTVVIVWLLSHVWLFVTPWTTACQVFLSFTISQSLLKPMSIELMMPSNYLILCRPPLHREWECKLIQSQWKITWRQLKKFKSRTAI